MPEIPYDSEQVPFKKEDTNDIDFDPVCIDVARIYDSCGAKDCLRDLPVFFTTENQAIVDCATSVRITKASVITSTVEVNSVAFHRGFYSVDMVFYFAVCCEVYTGAGALPATVTGLATYGKRVVLYGSDGNVKSFSSDTTTPIDEAELDCCTNYSSSLPRATVHISNPMALSANIAAVKCPVNMPFIPENVREFFGCQLVQPTVTQIFVTIGIFTITQLSRNVQLMIPSYDFCVPRKECAARTDDPCEAFSKIEFPTDSFFPPNSTDNDCEHGSFNCNCDN